MKKVGETLSQQLGTFMSKQSMNESTEKRNSRSKEELLTLYAPEKQGRYCRERERCVTGSAPKLSEVMEQFGEDTALGWLVLQLTNLDNIVGYVRKLEQYQYKDLASMILNRYGHLKLTEIMLFLNDCKAGEYGRSYGYVDIVQLLRNLKLFTMHERGRIIHDSDEKEKRKCAIPEAGKPITFEEYLLIKVANNDFDGYFGEAARQKANELKMNEKMPF